MVFILSSLAQVVSCSLPTFTTIYSRNFDCSICFLCPKLASLLLLALNSCSDTVFLYDLDVQRPCFSEHPVLFFSFMREDFGTRNLQLK